jgi:hypothetical protein
MSNLTQAAQDRKETEALQAAIIAILHTPVKYLVTVNIHIVEGFNVPGFVWANKTTKEHNGVEVEVEAVGATQAIQKAAKLVKTIYGTPEDSVSVLASKVQLIEEEEADFTYFDPKEQAAFSGTTKAPKAKKTVYYYAGKNRDRLQRWAIYPRYIDRHYAHSSGKLHNYHLIKPIF